MSWTYSPKASGGFNHNVFCNPGTWAEFCCVFRGKTYSIKMYDTRTTKKYTTVLATKCGPTSGGCKIKNVFYNIFYSHLLVSVKILISINQIIAGKTACKSAAMFYLFIYFKKKM